jgi:hypothetical protein
MKLQLLAEDIAVSLEDHSTHAMQRMPRALAEVRTRPDGHPLPVATRDRLYVVAHAPIHPPVRWRVAGAGAGYWRVHKRGRQ